MEENNLVFKSNIKYSNWKCELFGMGPMGITVTPLQGNEPNWFWRWTQYIILGNKWIYEKDKNTKA